MRRAILAAAVSVAALCCMAGAKPQHDADAIVRLLNSRHSGSPRLYAAAATTVAADAKRGKPVQQFILAVLARDKDAPAAAKLDPETAKRYLAASASRIRELAEKKNNPLAWYLLALEANDTKMLERAAQLGNVQAMNALATMRLSDIIDGRDTTGDRDATMAECRALFEKAAATGDANALNNLALCHQNGFGGEKDEKKALALFQKAADAGHSEAVNNLGRFYREGITVPKDLAKAARCFETSAALGNVWGQLNYAAALMRGEGVKKNGRRAIELFESIAARGVAEAMDILARCHAEGMAGLPQDHSKAAVWRIRALAARGDANAARWLEANGEKK